MKTSIDRNKKIYSLQTFLRDAKIIVGTAIVMVVILSFHVKSREHHWKSRWCDCRQAQSKAELRSMSLEIRKQREGSLYETQTPAKFIESVRTCSSNSVNNVYYVGTSNDYDCFIHNSDVMTRRVRVHSTHHGNDKRFLLTDDVSCWVEVATVPASAASDLAVFLDAEHL